MAGASGIEFLSLLFTAGTAAGIILSGGNMWVACAVLLPLSALPCFFPNTIINAGRRTSEAVFGLSFLALGLFTAMSRSLVPEAESWAVEVIAAEAADSLKALIGRIPFKDGETAALLTALLTGDRSLLSPETVRAFRASGAAHILALSGLHIGIIYMVADKLLSVLLGRAPWTRWPRFVIITGSAAWFTLMTGAGPSITRAFLFIFISEILRLLCRPRKPLRVLCLALLIQLVIDPEAISSIGFQLSYLAMAGIFIIYPRMEKWYPESSSPVRKIWQSAALSISCQVFTGPLVWFKFHSFPKYFLLTNLIALPLTTVIMTAGITTVLLTGLHCCPGLLITITEHLCHGLTEVLEIIADM